MPPQTAPAPPTDANAAAQQDAQRLVALAGECETAGITRHCLVLRLSCLPAELRKPHHLRLARDALDPLMSASRAHRFILPHDDIAVVWRGPADAALAASQNAIMRMFADADAMLPDPGSLMQLLDLPVDADMLRALLAAPPPTEAPPAEERNGEPLDASALAALEAALAQADVSRFARRRTVCGAGADGRFRAAWDIRDLAVAELCAELADGRVAAAEPWLYRRLARTLDRRLLALLATNDELRAAGPFGLNLDVASVLGPDFLRFDTALPTLLRGRVTLGFQPSDVLADLPAFLFARDFARARRYRLLLRLPTCDMLPILPTARLGLDLVEVGWSSAAITVSPQVIGQEAGHMLLAGADTAEAVTWGLAHGVRLFEGRAAVAGRPIPGAPPG